MLHAIFSEDLADTAALTEQTTGWQALCHIAAGFPPEDTQTRTGVDAEVLRGLAGDFAAAAYGRTGACLTRFRE